MYRIVEEPLSADAVARAVTVPESGGVAVFLGVVRNQTAGRRVVALEYEAHVPMAEAKLKEIGEAVYAAVARCAAGRDPAPDRAPPRRRGERGDRRLGRAPSGRLRGLPVRDRYGQANRSRLEAGAVRGWIRVGRTPGRIAAAGVERRRWSMTGSAKTLAVAPGHRRAGRGGRPAAPRPGRPRPRRRLGRPRLGRPPARAHPPPLRVRPPAHGLPRASRAPAGSGP